MKKSIGFAEALELTLASAPTGGVVRLPLAAAGGRFLAEEISSRADSPSISSSRKDGFAVISADLAQASAGRPARLHLKGSMSAGGLERLHIGRGETVRVTTGARLPEGAEAVISEEYCRTEGSEVVCTNTAGPGRNILACGTDVAAGERVARAGAKLTPPLLGLIAAAGHGEVPVFSPPRAAVIATGDEVTAPGEPLAQGGLYASNMVEIGAWLSAYGIPFETAIVRDVPAEIREAVRSRLDRTDLFLTSGGAWGSEKDLILQVVESMLWQGVYHRVRMGPGKPVGFGMLSGKPFFVLPGGPPSNEMAFLQLALPALMKMQGGEPRVFASIPARLSQAVHGERGWTEFIHARLSKIGGVLCVNPARLKSRLRSMAEKQALIVIPEERDEIPAGEILEVQLMQPVARIQ
jgi:molybdopterin molybdotransferase